MTTCQTPLLVSLFVSLLAKSQELPVIQLVRHVDLFHMVITDNQRSETLSLPPSLGPSYKAHHPIQPSCYTLNLRVSPAVCNKSFFSTCGVVFIRQFLTCNVTYYIAFVILLQMHLMF
jgi:hypothetical protein